MSDDLLVKQDGPILRVTINRPDHGNAATDPMAVELTGILEKIPETTRLVVLRGAGKDFCVGRAGMGAREVGLFVVNSAGIDVNQVVDVRVRDGYSFVDVHPSVVDAVLTGVNGKEHDGRAVKAEVARKQRGDEPAVPAPAGDDEPGAAKP